jgi:hypothetical protein
MAYFHGTIVVYLIAVLFSFSRVHAIYVIESIAASTGY